jgi:hypothetical protein
MSTARWSVANSTKEELVPAETNYATRMKPELLDAAVDVAARDGATVVEGWPIADTYASAETFEGREHVSPKCGFMSVSRPSPCRAIMRRKLTG